MASPDRLFIIQRPIVRSLRLDPDLERVADGRELVAEAAREAGFSDPRTFDIVLSASEAMANAIEHSPVKGRVEVKTVIYPSRLEVQVEGAGRFRAPSNPVDRIHRGLGLPLMAKFADHLALYTGPRGGTLVSLSFYREGAERDDDVPHVPHSIMEIAAAAERGRLFQALDAMPDMVCILTPDHRIAFANRAFRDRFGEAGNRHCYEANFGLTAPCEFCQAFEVLRTGQPQHWELTGEDETVIAVHNYPFRDLDGSPLILEIDVDITESRRTEAELAHYRQSLEELIEQRTAELREARDLLCGVVENERDVNPAVDLGRRAAVDGQMRMVELKKEVNDLLAAAGQPPKYPLDSLEGQ